MFILAWGTCVISTWLWEVNFGLQTHTDSKAAVGISWPTDCDILRSPTAPTLLLFVHPHCSCTRATVTELSRLLSEGLPRKSTIARPLVLVVATIPETGAEDWPETANVLAAAALSDRDLIVDRGGIFADQFGVVTSGTVMLFDTAGHSIFLGGITASRGHVGENSGLATLKNLLNGKATSGDRNLPVFGCRLCLPDEEVNVRSSDAEIGQKQPGMENQEFSVTESASNVTSACHDHMTSGAHRITQFSGSPFLCHFVLSPHSAHRSATLSIERKRS